MFRRAYTRVRRIDPFAADALLAAGFALAGVIESAFVASHGHSRVITAIGAALVAVPVAWRRRNTLLAIAGYVLVLVAQAPLDSFLFQSLTAPFVEILLLAYTAGRNQTGRPMWAGVALLALGGNVASAIDGGLDGGDIVWTCVLIGAPLLAGRGIRARVLLQREMREKAERLAAERDVRARRAVEDERSRIASELQAVVANGVSAMVVQAGAVPRLLDSGDTERAAGSLALIEETGRDALAEMRRLLGVLRRDDEGPALAPQPTLASVDALVARMEAEGLDAELSIRGQPVALSPGVDLAAYRVLQEALASARGAEGASHADVEIVYGRDDVTLRVVDDRESGGGTHASALLALRERVGLYGGALRVVSREDRGGFEVEARLPAGSAS